MKILPLLLTTFVVSGPLVGCASKDPYEDPTYALQRKLTHRNEKWDSYQNRQSLRRQARDDRYQSWFNTIMQ